jgi:glycosyltransferase involved in cell wall biosynthesis
MQKWPKISIVTPTYNCGHLKAKCIESVLAQNYPNLEHIVVDGASKDNTVEVLKSYPHIRWISEKDTGEANALNKALKMATGDVVCWLNADDYFFPDALIPVGELFMKNPSWELVYGNTHMVDPEGKIIWEKISVPDTSLKTLVRWWDNTTMPHQPSMFFSRSLLARVGPLNEHLHFSIDLELWLRCAVEAKFHYINRTLSCATQRDDCKSGGTEVQQIQSHWKVLLPFLAYLPVNERIDFWHEYYLGRLTGLKGHTHLDPTRFPDSEEALLGLVRAISLHPQSLAVVAH